MAPTKVFSSPKNTGDRLTAAEINQLDDEQYARLANEGTSTLAGNATIATSTHSLFIDKSGGGDFYFSHTVTDVCGPVSSPIGNDADWDFGYAAYCQQLAASKTLRWWLHLPATSVLQTIKLYVEKPAAGAGLPTLPKVGLAYVTMSSGAATDLSAGGTSDPSGSEAAYETYHAITISSINHTIATGRNYYIYFIGDSNSTGTSDGLKVYRPMVTVECSQVRWV